MNVDIRTIGLYFAKALGCFYISRLITGNKLRILCYHGVSIADEADWRPGLFVTQQTLRKRFQRLKALNYPVIDLTQASVQMQNGTLPRCAIVITFDDGFYSVFQKGLPVIHEFGFPVTVYVTTYYVLHAKPVFRLAVQYIYWRARQLRLSTVTDTSMWDLIEFGETQCSEDERWNLLMQKARELSVDLEEIRRTRRLSLMTPEEIGELHSAGIDIQLHTHRHRLPEDRESALREISNNREILEPIVSRGLSHFCYPSGIWSHTHLPYLAEAGVSTATTCEPGLNHAGMNPLTLFRYLDAETKTNLQFEAEISGFKDILQTAFRYLRIKWTLQASK